MKPETPLLAVDCVIIRRRDVSTSSKPFYEVLLIERKNPPFQGCWALPGGFVDVGETVEDAVIREVKEETNLDLRRIRFLDIYDDPKRDERGHVVSVAYMAFPSDICEGAEAEANDDAASVGWFIVGEALHDVKLAFDHDKMIAAALNSMFDEMYPTAPDTHMR